MWLLVEGSKEALDQVLALHEQLAKEPNLAAAPGSE